MKNLVFLISLLTVIAEINGQEELKFGVNLTSSDDITLYEINSLNEIEHRKYTEPNGLVLYFTKRSFACIELAQQSLDSLKKHGFERGVIRVFINQKLVSEEAGQAVIKQAKLKNCSDSKKGEAVEVSLVDVKKEIERSYNVEQYEEVIYGKEDYDKAHIPEEQTVLTNEQKAERIKLMLAIKNKGLQNENDSINSILMYDLKRNDLAKPIYRIQILSAKKNALSDSIYAQIDSLIGTVKVFKEKDQKVYTTHVFDSPLEITDELEQILDLGFNAKLVGEYKGVIISEQLTNLIVASY
jgi:hypothetical protein